MRKNQKIKLRTLAVIFAGVLLYTSAYEQPYWTLAAHTSVDGTIEASEADAVANAYDMTPPEIDPGKLHIACIGDSITYGAGVINTRDTQSYPAYLQELVPENYQVLNYGLGGRTLVSTGNMPYCEEEYYQISVKESADVYLIMLGTNDAKTMNWDEKRYRRELQDMVETYQKLDTKPTVYLITPPKCYGQVNDETDADNAIIKNQVRTCIQQVGEATGVTVIDIYPMFAAHPWWIADYIHPGAKGNQHLAAYIYRHLQDELIQD